ncbi:hypothetical protein PCCS19_05350 [Paenibacillus sp. CCS19]|uniref:hypothetical protein n=1 Tax=Paenibacillus sp. CCS19 TaxID=3158387 RepID=UPI002566B8F2|nr:hypothetical protein [Paenibacillus cellulosilyticus]GMK37481.1 hypothetical protein PCCS19_05350 [Paenibacillus cellulosilyticus]
MKRSQTQDAQEQNELILQKAGELGITGSRLIPGSEELLELSYKGRTIIINRTRSHKMPLMAGLLAQNKQASNQLFEREGLPVPAYAVIEQMGREAISFLFEQGTIVVKPLDRSRSIGVTLRVSSEEELERAVAEALRHSKKAMLQKYVEGFDYRVLVVAGQAIGALEYRPAVIEGDGDSTIQQLVERLNARQAARGEASARGSFSPIDLTAEPLPELLEKAGKRADSVLARGERWEMFAGGSIAANEVSEIPIDRTLELHPDNAAIAVRAAAAIHLDVAGVDLRCRDLSQPLGGDNGGIIEVNALPDMVDPYLLFRHRSVDVFELYLRYLFEE